MFLLKLTIFIFMGNNIIFTNFKCIKQYAWHLRYIVTFKNNKEKTARRGTRLTHKINSLISFNRLYFHSLHSDIYSYSLFCSLVTLIAT